MMQAEKTLTGLIRALPDFLRMEETKGLGRTFKNQWGGGGNTWKIVYGIFTGGQGFLANMRDLGRVKVGKIIPNWAFAMWDTFSDREAIVDGEKRYTYGELKERVLKIANALQALGVKPKDAVAAMLFNSSEFLELLDALSLLGATMPFVNWHLKDAELRGGINLRQPKVFVFHADFLEEVLPIKDGLTSVEHFIMAGGDGAPPEGILSYEELMKKHGTAMPDMNFLTALNPYTGGTTGTPKSSNLYDSLGYVLSDLAEAPRESFKRFMQYSSKAFSYLFWFGGDRISDPISENMRTLIVTPMYHAGTAASWAPCFMLGATGVLMRKFDAEECLRLIEAERINWTFVAPTILQRILALPDEVKRKYWLGSMRALICAAAPCPPEVKRDINQLFMEQGAPEPVFGEYYGSAETAIITVLLPQDYLENPKRIESVGKARCGDLKVYIEDDDRWAEPREVGKIMGRTASTLSLRYPGSEERLHESIKMIKGQEWYDDGLMGYLDEDGFLYLTGRMKEMIISGGVNVYPIEIERVILRHPEVFDVAVVRLPHPDLGEVPIACVQLHKDKESTEEEILSFCREQGLHGYKLPARVEILKELPRHIDGKIIKRELEERYWKDVEKRG
ncbi:MAG: class I adenylate-forming enzyme family protein [Actinomycetota bacterium]|nr:class I adenylate-forming enzyme family protein [Actinomycetota bacterium]